MELGSKSLRNPDINNVSSQPDINKLVQYIEINVPGNDVPVIITKTPADHGLVRIIITNEDATMYDHQVAEYLQNLYPHTEIPTQWQTGEVEI